MIKFSYFRGTHLPYQPTRSTVAKIIAASLQKPYASVQLVISIIDQHHSRELNNLYRQKDHATNVISLEYAESRDQFNFLSGELFLCDSIIVSEAAAQKKTINAHYMHMLVHGLLHIQGYDHQYEQDAITMETLEINILSQFAIVNPYLE